MSKNENSEECLLEKQAELEKRMLQEFEDGSYTFNNPLIKLDPYDACPLAAVVLFKTEVETAVTVTVRGKEAAGDISHTYPAAKSHILPVLGLYADYNNTVEIRLYQGAAKTLNIKTGPLTGVIPQLIHMKTTARHLKKDVIIVSPSGAASITGFDYKGDIRWCLSITARIAVKRMRNGHLMVGGDRMIQHPYFMASIYEIDMVGKIYKEFLLPGGYHHDQFEMPDGDLLVLTEDLSRDTVEDMLVLIDRETGRIKRTWDFKDFMSPGDGKSGNFSEHDWFHNNAVWYDEKTNSLTLSGRHIDAMVNISFDTGKLNWIIGDPEKWPSSLQKYFFKPVGDNFSWQYAQHSCVITPCGDVMCFDNGTLRSKNEEKFVKNRDNFSRGVRYRINTEDMTIEQVWEFGRELGRDFFSQHISNVEYYDEGYYLVHSGGQQFVDGEPAESILPFAEDNPAHRCESVTLEVYDGEIVLDLRVAPNYYRAKRLSLYYGGAGLILGAGKVLGG